MASAPPTSGVAKPGLAGLLSGSIPSLLDGSSYSGGTFPVHPACPARSPSPGPHSGGGNLPVSEQVVAFTSFLFLACDHHAQWAPVCCRIVQGPWAALGQQWSLGEQGLGPSPGGPGSPQISQAWPLAGERLSSGDKGVLGSPPTVSLLMTSLPPPPRSPLPANCAQNSGKPWRGRFSTRNILFPI